MGQDRHVVFGQETCTLLIVVYEPELMTIPVDNVVCKSRVGKDSAAAGCGSGIDENATDEVSILVVCQKYLCLQQLVETD